MHIKTHLFSLCVPIFYNHFGYESWAKTNTGSTILYAQPIVCWKTTTRLVALYQESIHLVKLVKPKDTQFKPNDTTYLSFTRWYGAWTWRSFIRRGIQSLQYFTNEGEKRGRGGLGRKRECTPHSNRYYICHLRHTLEIEILGIWIHHDIDSKIDHRLKGQQTLLIVDWVAVALEIV